MNRKFLNVWICCALGCCAACTPQKAAETTPPETMVKVGDKAPGFTVTTTDGAEISTEKLAGKVILLNFFATWCGPCMTEMPRVESEVWQKFKDRGLVVVAIGREHSTEEMIKFKAEKKLTLPVAPDPKRVVFRLYATQNIPRNFLIGADGRIVFESSGFNPEEFGEMVKVIEKELGKTK